MSATKKSGIEKKGSKSRLEESLMQGSEDLRDWAAGRKPLRVTMFDPETGERRVERLTGPELMAQRKAAESEKT